MTGTAGDAAELKVIRGEVVLPAAGVDRGTATLIVQLEDVSRADAPSIVVGEQRSPVELSNGAELPFAVEVDPQAIDAGASYSLRVHVARAGAPTVTVGDYVSTQSYPVLTRGNSRAARIEVRRVG